MTTHKDRSSYESFSFVPANIAQEDLSTILLEQNNNLRTHLLRTFLFITITTLVVFMHQIFLVGNQVGNWHSLVHYSLLAITLALISGIWFTWRSYYQLNRNEKAVVDAYTHSKQLSKTTGNDLRKSESLLESLFDASTDRILVIDSQNRIVKANKVAEKWAGSDPCHREFTEIFPICDNQDEVRGELSLIELTRTTQVSYQGRLLRGGVDCSMLLSVDTYPVSLPENDLELVIEIARDVTEQTGRELASRHREKMAALGLLVAGFAHDLGNPLASLSSELELLRENEPEKIYESLDNINEHVARIKRKLHDLVQFARSPEENRQDVNIRVAIDHALKLTRYDPRARRIHFETDVHDRLLPVRMKEDDLVLVLINLIVNAFDAMPRGGTLAIKVSMADSDNILLTVSDTGIGMDAETLKQATLSLFTTKHAADAHGTGLGLTMAKQLMASAGGELTLESNPGHGTRVTLRMPVVEIEQQGKKGGL